VVQSPVVNPHRVADGPKPRVDVASRVFSQKNRAVRNRWPGERVRRWGMYGTISPFHSTLARSKGFPMAEVTTNGQGSQPQLMLQKIYVKDVSFEAPNAPQIFQAMGENEQLQPQIQLNVGQKATDLGNDLYEVALSLTLTCTLGERTAYLAEVEQAGLFGIAGFSEAEHAGIIGSYCPNLLFPYARQVISSLVLEGGFPPFLLQPINFDALYSEQMRRLQSGDEAPTTLNS
jgi:preprotein translocase subunit SecB